jgi:hypothetical protein
LLVVEELRWLGSNWDSIFLTASIPKYPKGYFPPPVERVTTHHVEARAGNYAQEGRTLEALSPQQKIPQRRGRPGKTRNLGKLESGVNHMQSQLLKNFSCVPFGWNLSNVQIEKAGKERGGHMLKAQRFVSCLSS